MALTAATAQERINRVNVTIAQRSARLPACTGWTYDELMGKWVSHTGWVGIKDADRKNLNPSFDWLQTASFYFKGNKYFLLMYGKPLYGDPDPITNRRRNLGDMLLFNVMDMHNYERLCSAVNGQPGTRVDIILRFIDAPQLDDTEESMLAYITRTMEADSIAFMRIDVDHPLMKMTVTPVHIAQGDMVRFTLPGQNVIDSNSYFETTMSQFKSILLPITDADRLQLARTDVMYREYTDMEINRLQNEIRKVDSIENPTLYKLLYDSDPRNGAYDNKPTLTDWTSSDTLYASDFAIVANTSLRVNFDRIWMTNYKYKGVPMHTLFIDEGFKGGTCLILDTNDYRLMQRTMAQRAAKMVPIDGCIKMSYRKDDDLKLMVRVEIADAKHSTDGCIKLAAKDDIVQFRNCGQFNTGQFEAQAVTFGKLFLPYSVSK
jgi:hypothetical protein